MSIYCSMWTIKVEDEANGGEWENAWIEVYAQGVPNHINAQNGYGGPGWDEWLPAFVHKPDCQMRTTVLTRLSGEPHDWFDCDCGDRAVFICDDLTTKGTPRNGQEYVNPVLVLTGSEYRAIGFRDLMDRIEQAVSERRARAHDGERLYLTDDERDLILTMRAEQARRDAATPAAAGRAEGRQAGALGAREDDQCTG